MRVGGFGAAFAKLLWPLVVFSITSLVVVLDSEVGATGPMLAAIGLLAAG